MKRNVKFSKEEKIDNYPNFILTLDDVPEADYDGIRRRSALSFLLDQE